MGSLTGSPGAWRSSSGSSGKDRFAGSEAVSPEAAPAEVLGGVAAAIQLVVPRVTEQVVVTSLTIQLVVPVAAPDAVAARSAVDGVVAIPAADDVVTLATKDVVGAT